VSSSKTEAIGADENKPRVAVDAATTAPLLNVRAEAVLV